MLQPEAGLSSVCSSKQQPLLPQPPSTQSMPRKPIVPLPLSKQHSSHISRDTSEWGPTSFWPGEALVQVKDDFLHKVLNVTVLRAPHEHHPVMGEALHSGFLPHLGSVAQLQFHLNGTLERDTHNREAKAELGLHGGARGHKPHCTKRRRGQGREEPRRAKRWARIATECGRTHELGRAIKRGARGVGNEKVSQSPLLGRVEGRGGGGCTSPAAYATIQGRAGFKRKKYNLPPPLMHE